MRWSASEICSAPILRCCRAISIISWVGFEFSPTIEAAYSGPKSMHAALCRVILFVGGDAAHNRDAVRFLTADLLPSLPASARLLIVGKAGAAAPSGHPQIRSLGFVEDLSMCFSAADVAVNPVGFGSGTNVKLAEYVAAGLPAISTPIGLRGVPHLANAVRTAARTPARPSLSSSSLCSTRPQR